MHILESSENTVIGKVARGSSARRAAALMNYGNLIAILLPFPLLIFWFGALIRKSAITPSKRRTVFMASPVFSL